MGTNSGLGLLSAQMSVLQSSQDHAMQAAKSSKGASDDAKIEKGATEFEAVLVGSWLQQAEQSFATVPGADDDEDAGQRDQVMSLGIQSLSTSLAASGGIGIGKMIAKAMHAEADKANGTTGTPPEPEKSKRISEKIGELH
jgi:Rod binding domain-containing protein